jgi:hypothetical protein
VEIADVDMLQGVLMNEQPVFEHWVVHKMGVVIEAVECEMGEGGRPLEEEGYGGRSFFAVGYAEGREGCGAKFLCLSQLAPDSSGFVPAVCITSKIDKG